MRKLLVGLVSLTLLVPVVAAPVAAANPFEGNDIKELREELRGTGIHTDWKKPLRPSPRAIRAVRRRSVTLASSWRWTTFAASST